MSKPVIFIATQNDGKINEFTALLKSHFQCVSPSDPDYRNKLNVAEDGETYYENALKKAMRYFKMAGMPVISDDSGLEVDVLKGEPGVRSARYGGENLSWPDRCTYLTKSLSKFKQSEWVARFRSVVCYYDGKQVPYFFEGTCEGLISPRPRGDKGFGYDPIFIFPPLNSTLAELSTDDKERVSHRAEAARNFLKWWPTNRFR